MKGATKYGKNNCGCVLWLVCVCAILWYGLWAGNV